MTEAAPPTTFDDLVRAVARVEPARGGIVGTVLGETYELTERIGGGGMGVVFRARDRRLGRDVAVKLLRATGEGDQELQRLFEREARATAQLLHPNIVTLHHVGEHDGQPYLVLELLAGETLAARLARRVRLPLGEALAVIDLVLAAIAFAHQRGVLHRDLKPSNVFVTSDERIKVLDFGIALSLDTDVGPVTRSAGTPGYMAPEQSSGSDQDVRTDVWSAARLLVECMLGRRPGEGDAVALLGELELDRGLRAVLARALDADPAKRPESADELRLLIAATTRTRASRPRRRLIIGLAIVAVAAIATAAVALATRSPAVPPVSAAEINGKSFNVEVGELTMRIDPDGAAYGVFATQDGIVTGHFADGVFTGYWCNVPSRRPPLNAGSAKLHFIRGEGRLLIDGSWIFGDEQAVPWHADFFGVEQAMAPTAALVERLQRHELCPEH
ncbi:MAG TPA: serine/threonine-protein kinase [Kofleriaceae bacterium]|nr:serine/threonine-protein kinase [Kofleriaceae bacterium]